MVRITRNDDGSADHSKGEWEIEQGYREQKQYMLGNRLTLRSRLPELVKQELWGSVANRQPYSVSDCSGQLTWVAERNNWSPILPFTVL